MTRRPSGRALVLLLGAAACARNVVPSGPRPPRAEPSRIETSVYLIGDGGNPAPAGEPVLAALSSALARDPARSFVIFLGDNIYPRGLDDDSSSVAMREQKRRLAAQLVPLLENGVRGIVVPGNHDWARHGPSGWASIQAQERFVRDTVAALERALNVRTPQEEISVELLPKRGCPGPWIKDVGDHLRVLVLDTQWWLHPFDRPNQKYCGDDAATRTVERIRAALAGSGGRRTLVVAHHPLETAGEHGGYFDLKSHLFPFTGAGDQWFFWVPLPLLGSLYPLARMHGVDPQDLSNAFNCRMRAVVDSAFRPVAPDLYAAGHDHGLQVLKGGAARYEAVSGGGIYGHTDRIGRHRNSLFSATASGFMRLDVMRDGSPPRLGVHVVNEKGEDREVFAMLLDDAAAAATSLRPRVCRDGPRAPDLSVQVPGRD